MVVNFIFNYSVIQASAYQVKKYIYLCYQLHGSVGRQNFLFLFFDWREKRQPITQMSFDKSIEEKKTKY